MVHCGSVAYTIDEKCVGGRIGILSVHFQHIFMVSQVKKEQFALWTMQSLSLGELTKISSVVNNVIVQVMLM